MENNSIKLFEIQSELCRMPLPKKVIEWNEWYREKPELIENIERVLFFDPSHLYKKIGHLIDPFKRTQSIQMEQMFPKIEFYCACGCGKKAKCSDTFKPNTLIPTWQRKWHSDSCGSFASSVLSIINNTFQAPVKHITYYSGKKCSECEDIGYTLELDHIIGVKQGGGGCWLSNYRWLCKNHHVSKTNKDFKRKEFKTK